MRNRRLLIVLLAVVLIGAFVLTGVAIAGPRRSSSFTLVATADNIDVPADRGVTWTDTLTTLDGEPIEGWDGGRCTNLHPDPADIHQWVCDMTVRLPEGDIFSSVAVDYSTLVGEDWVLVFGVTGGTNAFRNARGEIAVLPHPSADSAYVEFRLIGASASY